jgi:glyoxylase-like metal-dependent hydrolase (beta-lactamase superfamily II)
MWKESPRRDFCRLLLAGAAGAALPRAAWAQTRQTTRTTLPTNPGPVAAVSIAVDKLTDNLMVISGAGGNVTLALGPDSALLVNSGSATQSAALVAKVAELAGGKPVKTLFNTDWHADHTGGNDAFAKAGASIVAHEFTKQYLGSEMRLDWQGGATYKPRAPIALPKQVFYSTGSATLGDEKLEYGHLGQAHTDGDIYVFFRNANVMVAGDVLSVGKYPLADYNSGGWLGGMATANKTLLDMTKPDTRYVPGFGAVQPRAGMQAHADMLKEVRDRMHQAMRKGMGAEDMLASGLTKDLDAAWGSPEQFLSVSYRGMWLHIRELGGVV